MLRRFFLYVEFILKPLMTKIIREINDNFEKIVLGYAASCESNKKILQFTCESL